MGQILRKWQWAMKEEVTLEEIVERAIVESGLEASFEAEDTDEAKERLSNLQEVVSAAADFATRNPEAGLKGFLEEVALVSDADTKKTDEKTAILQTLHTSKGLEYDVVCLAGCEEGLFPMLRQDGGTDALEEERRLFYVGATRARKKLHIFNARIRTRFGVRDACIPSRFLDEIDTSALNFEAGAAPRKSVFSGGDLDDSRPQTGYRNTQRRPAFPPGALRSVGGDRPTFGAATVRAGSSGPLFGHHQRPHSLRNARHPQARASGLRIGRPVHRRRLPRGHAGFTSQVRYRQGHQNPRFGQRRTSGRAVRNPNQAAGGRLRGTLDPGLKPGPNSQIGNWVVY
jgi:hypothetical protein